VALLSGPAFPKPRDITSFREERHDVKVILVYRLATRLLAGARVRKKPGSDPQAGAAQLAIADAVTALSTCSSGDR